MIEITYIPIRDDSEINYEVQDDVLYITVDGETEELDFTGAPEGAIADIELEKLPFNPIIYGSKTLETVALKVMRPYKKEEKEEFEF